MAGRNKGCHLCCRETSRVLSILCRLQWPFCSFFSIDSRAVCVCCSICCLFIQLSLDLANLPPLHKACFGLFTGSIPPPPSLLHYIMFRTSCKHKLFNGGATRTQYLSSFPMFILYRIKPVWPSWASCLQMGQEDNICSLPQSPWLNAISAPHTAGQLMRGGVVWPGARELPLHNCICCFQRGLGPVRHGAGGANSTSAGSDSLIWLRFWMDRFSGT